MGSDLLIFNKNQIPIYQTIEDAKEFIKIVAFQITSEKIISLLKKKAEKGIKIEIITLPADSYKKSEERQMIDKFYEELRAKGAQVDICDWEVGDPTLTDTSQSGTMAEGGGDKWYSMHGKFIVTDQNALLLTANLIDKEQWDAYLTIRNDDAKAMLIDAHQRMRELFIIPSNKNKKINGKLYDKLPEDVREKIDEMWRVHRSKRIKGYDPSSLSPVKLTSGLKISPFEGRARDFLQKMVADSEEYLYICSERIFDEEFIPLLRKKIETSKIDVKILANPPQMVRQSPEKATDQLLQLLALNVNFRCLRNSHSKLWTTEKWLMIGSSNITKMNLGFYKTKKSWRSNTEILYFTNDMTLTTQAKKQFEELFEKGEDGILSIAERPKNLKIAKSWFETYSSESTPDARKLLSQIISYLDIGTKKNVQQIVKFSIKIAQILDVTKIDEIHVTMAYIIFEIQFKAQTKAELIRLHGNFLGKERIDNAISELINLKICRFSDNQLVLNVDKILNV